MAESLSALIVDDEEGIRATLQVALERTGYAVRTASSGEEALESLRDQRVDAAVVDLDLGGYVDGLRVLEAVRWRWPETVVVILTAHGSLNSAVAALRERVDDYLLKPTKPSEVCRALERALDRRRSAGSAARASGGLVQSGQYCINVDQHHVTVGGDPVSVTPQELRLLLYLMQNTHRVVPAEELVDVVREFHPETSRAARDIIRWYIHRLRRRIEPDPAHPRHIMNLRGVGYRFKE